MAGVGDCACAGLAFLAATLFVFTPLPFALALFETVLVAEAFAAVAFRGVLFLVAVRRVEPVASLGLAAPVAVSTAVDSAGAALFRPGLRADAVFLSAPFGFLVAPLALASKASATTASASSKASYRVSIVTFMVRSRFLCCGPRGACTIGKPTIGCPSLTIVASCVARAASSCRGSQKPHGARDPFPGRTPKTLGVVPLTPVSDPLSRDAVRRDIGPAGQHGPARERQPTHDRDCR